MQQSSLYRITLLVVCLLLVGCASQARAQASDNATVNVDIDLISPPPSCSFTVLSDLDYGTAEKPISGSGSVTISPTSGSRTSSGTTVTGSSSVGRVRLSGSNVSSYTVTRSFPSTLTRSGGSLSFSGTWAQSSSSSSGYSTISGSSYNGSAGGAGSSFTRYFRYGGTVSGISMGDPDGNYDNTISASATCN